MLQMTFTMQCWTLSKTLSELLFIVKDKKGSYKHGAVEPLRTIKSHTGDK